MADAPVDEHAGDLPVEEGLFLEWSGRKLSQTRIPAPRVLEPDARLSSKERGENLVIEGDNLQAMVSLRSQFNASVDVAYIDPPYNTGQNDFRYSDKRFHDPNANADDAVYISNEDGGRHTKWLNYMAPRLALIHEMMADHGVVFVSINDIELHRLGMLMDDIFGEANRVANIVWKGSADNNPTRVAVEHEYVLCYAKRISEVRAVWTSPYDEMRDDLLDRYAQLKAGASNAQALQREWRALIRENREALGRLKAYNRLDERGPYQSARRVHNPKPGGYEYDIRHPETKQVCKPPAHGYRFPEARMKELIREKRIVFGKDHDQIIQMKDYLGDYRDTLRSVYELDARSGIKTLKKLFGKTFDGFRNPKPVELIERLVGSAGSKDALVLDAFAGSGTTGHAVMRLNKLDGGNRRFILIEEGNGDDRYARTLISKRLKLAAKKEELEGNFTFLKTGKELDRNAILSLERTKIVNVICQTDQTGAGRGIRSVSDASHVIGANRRDEAIALVWNGREDSAVTGQSVNAALEEVESLGLRTPMRIYGTTCHISETPSFTFCQIPDEILASLYFSDDEGSEPEVVTAAGDGAAI